MRFFLAFFVTILSQLCHAQQYSYRHYTIFDGLPQNQCMNVFQDSQGFIWVATKGGITLFDGTNFTTIINGETLDGYPLGFFEINQTLFFYSTRQVFKLNRRNFQLLYSTIDESIQQIYFDSIYHHLLVLSDKRIIDFSPKKTKIIFIPEVDGAISIHCIHQPNQYLIGSKKGLYIISEEGDARKVLSGFCQSLQPFEAGVLFARTKSTQSDTGAVGLFYYSKGNIKPFYTPGAKVVFPSVQRSDHSVIAIQDENSWIWLNRDGFVIDSDSMPDAHFNGVFKDNYGLLWLNSEAGVYFLQSYAFRNYDEKSNMPKYIWSIIEDSSHVIKFAAYDGSLATMKKGAIYSENIRQSIITRDENLLFNGICLSTGETIIPTGNRIWISKNGCNQFFTPMANGETTYIMSLFEHPVDKDIYIGTTDGLFIYSIIDNSFTHFDLQGASVLDIEIDDSNRVWLASNKGIKVMKNGIIKPFVVGSNNAAMSIKCDYNGNVWYACDGDLHFNNHKNDFSVSKKQYYFITEYKQKYLIAGGIAGVLMVDIKNFYAGKHNSMRFFDRYNGFTGIECGQNGTCIDTKGNVWIPTSESVVKFIPEKLLFDTVPPAAFVYLVESAGSNFVFDTLVSMPDKQDETYRLNHMQNNIRITYHGLSYPCPERVKYRYRLVGNSDAWTETLESSATFTNLSPGNYCFELQAANENGFWTKSPLTFSFRIVPAFWQMLLFKICILLILTGGSTYWVYYIMKRKRIREKQKRDVERQLVNMQVGTINSQLDPHFIFNAITAIGSEVQEKNTDVAYDYFVKVSQLLRNSLKNSDTITRTLGEELQFVENYLSLQKFRFGDRFNYDLNVEKDINHDFVVPKMCIQIFVENAVKHGLENRFDGGLLLVAVIQNSDGLMITIEDNGIGRLAASKLNKHSTGIGLKAFREFFEIMNRYNYLKAGYTIEDLEDKNNHAIGTRVNLFIPFEYKYDVR